MLKVFISCAHDDHAAFVEMRTHLAAIERAFSIKFWAETRIDPGNYCCRGRGPDVVGVLQAAPMDTTGRRAILDWRPCRHGYDAAREQVWSAIAAKFGKPKPPFSWVKP